MWTVCVVPIVGVLFLSPGTNAYEHTARRREEMHSERTKRNTPRCENGACCGQPGRDGRDGRDGVQGPYGPPGLKGEPGRLGHVSTAELNQKLEEISATLREQLSSWLENRVNVLESTFSTRNPLSPYREPPTERPLPNEARRSDRSPGGAVYTRWGRNSCPGDAEALYVGVAAGSYYTQSGSGANYLCLPLNPQWNRTVPGHQSQSYLYGAEFEVSESNSGFSRGNSAGKLQHDHEVQCSVCHTPGRSSHVMIPARLECPSGWTVEYGGFIMSAHHKHQRTEYVCMDQDPNVHPGTSKNLNGALFYITEVVCGALPCPPFADGFETTCVVCTK